MIWSHNIAFSTILHIQTFSHSVIHYINHLSNQDICYISTTISRGTFKRYTMSWSSELQLSLYANKNRYTHIYTEIDTNTYSLLNAYTHHIHMSRTNVIYTCDTYVYTGTHTHVHIHVFQNVYLKCDYSL